MAKHPIDAAHLDKYVCGDNALLDEILTIFIDQAQGLAGRLDPGMRVADWCDVAHALKGAARGVGAWQLGDLAEDAEKLSSGAGDTPAARESLVAAIRNEIDCAIAYAELMREGTNGASPSGEGQ